MSQTSMRFKYVADINDLLHLYLVWSCRK